MMTMEMNQEVFDEYREMQRAGVANMTNKSAVQHGANDRGLYNLVAFIEDGDYYDILMNYDAYAAEYGDE